MRPMSTTISLSLITCFSLYAQTIHLDEGWNLIGTGNETTFSALQDADEAITKLYTYKNKEWQTTGSIAPYDGVWVKASSALSLSLDSGERKSQRVDTLTLEEGWNLISLPINSTITPRVFENAESIYKYTNGSWKLYAGDSSAVNPTLDYIGGGEGFWIKNEAEETIQLSDAESSYMTFASSTEMNDYLESLVRFHKSYRSDNNYWWGPVYALDDATAPLLGENTGGQASSSATASVTDTTSTNTQETDVDEADIVKHDGDKIFYLSSSESKILATTFDSILAGNTDPLQSITVEKAPKDMFLINDKLIVVYPQNYFFWSYWSLPAVDAYGVWSNTSTVEIYDVTDLSAISKTDTFTLDGNIVDTRVANGQLYVVNRYMPYIQVEYPETVSSECQTYDYPIYADGSATSGSAASASSSSGASTDVDTDTTSEKSKREDVVITSIAVDEPYPYDYTYYCNCDQDGDGTSDSYCSYDYENPVEKESHLIPQITHNGTATDLFSASTLYAPAKLDQSPYLTSIIALDLSDLSSQETLTSVGASDTLYASSNAIYTVSQEYPLYYDWESYEERSTIYRFGIQDGLSFDGKAFVPGRIRNQFNLSEYDGTLRIATTTGWSWGDNDTDNGVYTLQKTDSGLEQVGSLTGLGKPGETITGVRFMGTRGFMSTFEFKDPLYTIDLSDPTAPYVAGQLDDIPGYSSYFHPVDENLLLSIGRDADDEGSQKGIQIQLFDISDFSHPTLSDRVVIGDGWDYSSEAVDNHKAFTFRNSDYLFALPVNHYSYTQSDDCKVIDDETEDGLVEPAYYCDYTYNYESNLSLYQIDQTTKQLTHVDELNTDVQSYSNQRSIIFSAGDTDYAVFFNGSHISFKALGGE